MIKKGWDRASLPILVLLLILGLWWSSDFVIIAAGVAIFLLGMLALEDGFRTFTGGLLDKVLQYSTDRIWKSLLFGIVSTTFVQSSTLVSVLSISFLSAGLISLGGGIGVILGANLGTTTGAWLIAGFGLKVSMGSYAMPLLALGALLVFQGSKVWKGAGYILVGIGFFFLGIDFIKEGFESFKAEIDLVQYAMPGLLGLLVFTTIGIVATVVMQSSHASMVLILTALSLDQITYQNSLALAIGSNIGTTLTAILSGLGAQVEGRRLAGAHVIFNVLTGIVAIFLLQPLMSTVDWLSAVVNIAEDDYTLKLAMFHTLFNVLGIIIVLPLLRQFEQLLIRIIPAPTVYITQPKFLNKSAIKFSDAAIEAVHNETIRLYDISLGIVTRGVGIRRSDLFSGDSVDEVLSRSKTVIPNDISEKYALHVKHLYGEIVEYICRAGAENNLRVVEQLHEVRMAGSYLVEAIKSVQHFQTNLNIYLASPNQYARYEYDQLRAVIGRVLLEIDAVRGDRGDRGDGINVLSLDEMKLVLEKSDLVKNGVIDRLIREQFIDASIATSLINDSSYVHGACNKLLKAAQILFVSRDKGLSIGEQSIVLDETEIHEIVEDSMKNET
ncbi:MAG: Na/Pi cotransporter family protein [Pseudomonadales bacterium]|nr:Na/Pi cotransporter family protein [Pseudomonadales bacterium]